MSETKRANNFERANTHLLRTVLTSLRGCDDPLRVGDLLKRVGGQNSRKLADGLAFLMGLSIIKRMYDGYGPLYYVNQEYEDFVRGERDV